MGSDAIVADPATITGSIGVVFGKLNVRGFLEWIGAHVDTITFADYPSRYYSTVVTSGAPEKLTWLAADGAVIDSMEVALLPVDTAETVPPGMLPSSTSAP